MPFDQTKSVRRNRLLFFHDTLFRKKSFGFLTEIKIRLQVLESVSETTGFPNVKFDFYEYISKRRTYL